MMRIAYVAHMNTSPEDGVVKKVIDHVRQWEKAGHVVQLFLVSRTGVVCDALKPLNPRVYISTRHYHALGRLTIMGMHISQWRPDIVYGRVGMFLPYMLFLPRQTPFVIEVNGNQLVEYKVTETQRAYAYFVRTRNLMLRRAAGFVCVAHYLDDLYRPYQKPTVVISNGIDLAKYQVLPVSSETKPHLIYVGSHQAWQGIEQMFALARRFPDWHFDLVGINGEGLEIPPNVICYGFKPFKEYVSLMARAHVAIGALATSVRGTPESSLLKVREYLANGLPIILPAPDTDFIEPVSFIYKSSSEFNSEDNYVGLSNFVQAWMGQRVPRESIMHIDAGKKEASRLAFFEQVLRPAL